MIMETIQRHTGERLAHLKMHPPLFVAMLGTGSDLVAHAAGFGAAGARIVALSADAGEFLAGDPAARGARVMADSLALVSDPTVDLVAVVGQSPQRTHVICAAIEAGKHVLIAPPLAETMVEAETIARAARSAVGVCGMADETRAIVAYRAAADLLATGELGAIRLARLRLGGGGPGPGGLIATRGARAFALFRWLFGGVREIRGQTYEPDLAAALLTGTLGYGGRFEVALDRLDGLPLTERMEISGERGAVVVDLLAAVDALWYERGGDAAGMPLLDPARLPAAWRAAAITDAVADFTRQAQRGQPAAVTLDDGFYAAHVADVAARAVASGQTATLGG